MVDIQTLNRYRECLAVFELESRICESHLEATRQAYLQCERVVLDQHAKLRELRSIVEKIESAVASNEDVAVQQFG